MKAGILILVLLPFLVYGFSPRHHHEPHRPPSRISTYRHHRPNDAYKPFAYRHHRPLKLHNYLREYRMRHYNRSPYHGGHKRNPYNRFRMEKTRRPRKDDSIPRRPKTPTTESTSKPVRKPVRRPAIKKRPQKPPATPKKPSKKPPPAPKKPSKKPPPAPKVKERIPKKPSKNDRPKNSRPKSPKNPQREVPRKRKCRPHRHGDFPLPHDHDGDNCHSSHDHHMNEKSKCAKSINYKGKYLVSNLDDQACPLMTYTQANDFCAMQNLRAVTISSDLEDEIIDEIFEIANVTGDFWTGGFIEDPSRKRVSWGDELDDIVPALWALDQPDGPKSRRVRVSEIEFCVAVRQVEVSSEMDPPGLLHDEPCHRLAAAVCEEKPSSMTLGSRDPETEQRTEEIEEELLQLRREEEPMPFEFMDSETEQRIEEMEEILQLGRAEERMSIGTIDPESEQRSEEMEEILQLNDEEELPLMSPDEAEILDENQPLARQPFSAPAFKVPTFRPPFLMYDMPQRPFIPMHHDKHQRSFAQKYSENDLTNLCENIVKTFVEIEAGP